MTDRHPCRALCFFLIILTLLISACSTFTPYPAPDTQQTAEGEITQTPLQPQAEITFNLELAEGASEGDVFLEILDELENRESSPTRHSMDKVSRYVYSVKIPAVVGSVLKYRFTRGERNAKQETTCAGALVHARSFLVVGYDTSSNVICAWEDAPYKGGTGRISSQVVDAATKNPLGGIFVEAAGLRAITAADGSYLLEGLPPGTHTLFAYSLNGEYLPFQQGAVVAQQSNTPALLLLEPAKTTEVTFLVEIPASELPNLPVRLIGNIYSLGYTYAEMSGGARLLASRAPLLTRQQDGRYAITLQLPAGFDLRYKFTLGDAYWNSERSETGEILTRQLIVPASNTTIEAQVNAWIAEDTEPVIFKVSVPEITPVTDSVSIQFNAGNKWADPLPMWPLGGQDWYFILYAPIDKSNPLTYRYCRNEQCGVTDDTRTAGAQPTGLRFSQGEKEHVVINDTVVEWSAFQKIQMPDEEIISSKIRSGLFFSGVELQHHYQPSWQPHLANSMKDIKKINAGWVVFAPDWTYTSNNPPVLEPLPGKTPLLPEQQAMVSYARDAGLHVAVYPQMDFGVDPIEWWKNARRDSDWWQRWFEQYSTFALHYARWMQQMGGEMIILGGPEIAPATPGFKFPDGTLAALPGNSSGQWRALIAEIRTVFSGQVLWAVQYPDGLASAPEWIDSVDQIYLLWSAPLAKDAQSEQKEITAQVTKLLKENVLPIKNRFNKPILLGIAYPSSNGVLTGCVKVSDTCIDFTLLDQPTRIVNPPAPDFEEQSEAYRAIFKVINRDEFRWVSGLFSRGYYPPAALTDGSNSIHGKPVEMIITAWFKKLRQVE